MIFVHCLMKVGVVGLVTFLYYRVFVWNTVFAIFMIPLFCYLVSGFARTVVSTLFYIFSKPVILDEDEKIIASGIPREVTLVFFRPIFAKTFPEIENMLNSMKQDIINSQQPAKNLKFVVIDNTRDEEVKRKTRETIIKMQEEFGSDVVFYFHRNIKVDFFKKVGILFDAVLFLYEGATKPKVYISEKWSQLTKGLRNPQEPLWDIILGNIGVLGIRGTIDDVLKGKDVDVDADKRMQFCFVSDADNVWPGGEVKKLVAKMIHPENKEITIYQPSIELSNPDENPFIKMNYLAREMDRYESITKWRLYRFSPFYGKGAMNVKNYVEQVIKTEWLNPAKAASHDFQEALKGETVFVEDVHILEKTFSNKIAELKRVALWQWGDLETVRQFVFRKFSPGRKSHLLTLLRLLISDTLFNLWLIATVVGLTVVGLAEIANPKLFWCLFIGIVLVQMVVPTFVMPLVNGYKDKKYSVRPKRPLKVFGIVSGLKQVTFGVLVGNLNLIYQPKSFVENLIRQLKNRPFVWTTAAMAEQDTAKMSLIDIYKALWLSTAIGIIMLVLVIAGVPSVIGTIFLLPYMLSFLIGPFLIKISSK